MKDRIREPINRMRIARLERHRSPLLLFGLLLILGAGCAKVEDIRGHYTPQSPREAYERGLETSGLSESVMATAWLQAAEEAIRNPVLLISPYLESGYVDPAEPVAGAFRVALNRGQRLEAHMSFARPDTGQVFLDLFREMTEQGLGVRRVASSDSTQSLVFDATTAGYYVLRVQVELLAGGRYELSVHTRASIIFPVSGRDSRAIQSVFGDSRDAGRRSHHGVDIFAPRGTPVVAATDGFISSTRVGGLGGKTVWVRSSQMGGNLYYAHLDQQLVQEGARVTAGDTLGLVGNTGNARTTAPHLHFGIYRNGPIDPYPFVHEPSQEPARIVANTARAGSWMRTNIGPSIVRPGPSTRSGEKQRLDENTSVHILAATSNYYRIQLPDGTPGYISAVQVESEESPISERILASTTSIQRVPDARAGALTIEPIGNALSIRSRFGDYLRVTTTAGKTGWLLDI